MLELLKVLVQAVVLERDEDGAIIGERVSEAQALYSEEQIDEYFAGLRLQVANENANGKPSEQEIRKRVSQERKG